uniref:Odorant-binding protein 3 n=1 Tax=Dastarcus helophoroides TaxID=1169899 RepID=A0A1I9HZP0_9CUCU|nr:odorant-binding protein 3 [Dastarcus helophoroides]
MKLLVIFATLVVSINCLSQQLKESIMTKLEETGEKCMSKVGASDDDVAELIARKRPSRHEGMCMVHCFYEEFKIMDAEGNLSREESLKLLEPVKADDPDLYGKVIVIAKKCKEAVPKDSDLCLYATNLSECGVKESKAIGIEESFF